VATAQPANSADAPSSVTVNLPSIDVVRPQRVAAASDGRPMFRTLFQAGERSEPISPAVRDLWASGRTQGSPDVKLKRPASLDLFSDRTGAFST
jgi:predicted component of type VI protein secretion system